MWMCVELCAALHSCVELCGDKWSYVELCEMCRAAVNKLIVMLTVKLLLFSRRAVRG